jgi:hypothetical protein
MFKRNFFKPCALVVCIGWILTALCAVPSEGADNRIPHLRKEGTATQLIVDNKPFLILGGELGNSSSSSLDYMKPIWPRLVKMNLNTVLAPVYWDLIEPEEGQFDFTLVDGLIQDTRLHNLRLVLLWFASWKSRVSSANVCECGAYSP